MVFPSWFSPILGDSLSPPLSAVLWSTHEVRRVLKKQQRILIAVGDFLRANRLVATAARLFLRVLSIII